MVLNGTIKKRNKYSLNMEPSQQPTDASAPRTTAHNDAPHSDHRQPPPAARLYAEDYDLSTPYGVSLVEAVGALLARLVHEEAERTLLAATCGNDATTTTLVPPLAKNSSFHSVRVPPISIVDYVSRFARYSHCSPECLLLASMYMERYCHRMHVSLDLNSVHRLFITSVIVAVKSRDDAYYSNKYYAQIGGVHLQEMNKLEAKMVMGLISPPSAAASSSSSASSSSGMFVHPEEYYEQELRSIKAWKVMHGGSMIGTLSTGSVASLAD